MARPLPTESGRWLTDSGLETDLIFNHGVELPEFAAFTLLDDDAGERLLRDYFADHVRVAAETGHGIVLETPTWRAGRDWGRRLGYDDQRLRDANRRAVELVQRVRWSMADVPDVLVSGCVGPHGDGYTATQRDSAEHAQEHHTPQVTALADAGVDVVTALTLTYADEAVGITRAAAAAGVDVVVSFTVEIDGRLPDGTPLVDAIALVDAATDATPAYYMVNCAHPDHVWPGIGDGNALDRLRGVRANASRRSHAELDEAEQLDDGDPEELAGDLLKLRDVFRSVNVLGGCCGTDVRHIAALARAWT